MENKVKDSLSVLKYDSPFTQIGKRASQLLNFLVIGIQETFMIFNRSYLCCRFYEMRLSTRQIKAGRHCDHLFEACDDTNLFLASRLIYLIAERHHKASCTGFMGGQKHRFKRALSFLFKLSYFSLSSSSSHFLECASHPLKQRLSTMTSMVTTNMVLWHIAVSVLCSFCIIDRP